MTAEARTTSTGSSWLPVLVIIVALVGMAVIVIPGLDSTVNTNSHAEERHGADAWIARDWVQVHARFWHKWDCPDGRARIVVPMDDGHWAVLITQQTADRGIVEITSLICRQEYARSLTEGCKNPWRLEHP